MPFHFKKDDIQTPVANVSAKPTHSGAEEMPEAMTTLSMGISTKGDSIPPTSGGSGKAGATGPGKKSGRI